MYTNVIDNSGQTVKPETVVEYVQLLANRNEEYKKRNEELELLTEKLLEENVTLKEIVQGQNSDLDKNTEEILRLENKISELQCCGKDDNADDHELY